MIALTDENEVYLIAQYRYPTGIYSWEIPAGNADGTDPLAGAMRELQEETGLQATNWEYIGQFQPISGLSDEIGKVYLVTGLTETQIHAREEEGILEVKKTPFPQVWEMIRNGDITCSDTITALTLAATHLGKLTPTNNLYSVEGIVTQQKGRGKELGYPTANIPISQPIPDALYLGYTIWKRQTLPSLIFIGRSLTFGETEKKCESYLIDFNKDLYGEKIRLEIFKKIRDNKAFESAKQLIKQMRKDEAYARRYFMKKTD